MIKLLQILNYIDLHAWRHGFQPKRNHFRGQRFTAVPNLDMLDTRWSIAKMADSPPRDHLITMVKAEKENVRKVVSKNEKT